MVEKKSILIVSYLFAPQNAIGAVRPTKLAKYLTRMGHEVTVVCGEGMGGLQDPTLARDLQELKNVCVVREWNPLRDRHRQAGVAAASTTGGKGAKQGARSGMKQRVLNAVYLWLRLLSDRSFVRLGFREIRRMNRKFDVVLSTYGPKSVHDIAARAKAKGIAGRWIADFRDVAQMPFGWQRGTAERLEGRVRREADFITGVSKGYLAEMGLDERGIVITNGFDIEDLRGVPQPENQRRDRLTFMYCGQMYGSQRDLRPFFRAVKELVESGVIPAEQVVLGFAGKPQDAEEFQKQAAECGLLERVENHGLVPRDQAIGLQRAADAVLVAAWNTPELTGNLPGKMLEVLMLKRPVICCVAGRVPGSLGARLIRETGVGYCYEEAEGEASYEGLKDYVRSLCLAFAGGRPAPYEPNPENVERYAYAGIAGRFSGLVQGAEFDERG